MNRYLPLLILFFTITCSIIPKNPTDPNSPDYVKPYLVFDSTNVKNGDTVALDFISLNISGNIPDKNQYRYRIDSLTWSAWKSTQNEGKIEITLTEADTGNHRLAIQTCYNPDGDITDTAIVFVKADVPRITAMSDTAIQIASDQPLKMWVTITGTKPITCEWFCNGSPKSMVNKDSLIFDSVKMADQGKYYCVVSNHWGVDTSDTIRLMVSKTNYAPKWKADTLHFVLSEGQTLIRNLADSCTDRNGDSLTFKMLISPFGGDSLSPQGMFTFAAGPQDSGSYGAIAIVSDGTLADTAFLKVQVLLTPTYTVPSGINAIPLTTSAIRIYWGNVLRCIRYRVSRSLDTSETYSTVTETAATYCIDSGLTAATGYFYKITAIYPWGVSAASPPTEATTFPNPPGIPNVVSINAQSSTEIKIVWYTVNGATSGYKLYRSETKDGQFTKIKETTDTFYTDIGLVAETGYFYRVSAFNSGGESSQSITVTAITWPQPPGQPVGFAAVPTSKKGIALKWSPLVKADAYKLYRVESQPGNYLAIGPSTITDTFYNDTVGLNANTIYYYKLTGINVGGESPQAAFANATTYPDIPTPPTIGVSGGAGRADVTWSPVPYAISYNLYYAVGSTVSKSSKMTAGVTSPQHITGLAPGTQYAFAVTSVNISGESPFSTTQTIVTVPDPPFVSVTPGNGMVTVNWDSAAGATSYTLYFATGTTIDTTTFRYTNAKPPVIINSYPITNGVAYSFAVVSINSSGQSKLSNVASCMPVLPRKMVRITGGTFTMGSNLNDEGPPHQVTVSSFYMDSTPVTLADYQSVGGLNPGGSDGPQSPVCNLSWYDAALFCNQISKKGGLDTTYAYTAATMGSLGSCAGLTGLTIDYSKNGCRLPTEAEYEYACRAGTTTAYYWGDTINGDYCWYSGNSGGKPHDVTQKKPNTFGLYDISGNVWEYCNDYHASYDTTAKMNPTGPAIGTNRTRRGGSYAGLTELRSAARDDANKFPDSGFRCVRR